MATKTTARKVTTGEQAINTAMTAGFEITEHGIAGNSYRHLLAAADGRSLVVYTELNTGRLVLAEGRNRAYWNATYLAARNVKALRTLLDAGSKSPEQMPGRQAPRPSELSQQHQWALENERRLRNDIRRERRQIFGR